MTTAKVTWIPGPSIAIGDRTANEQTTDIAPVIQELVDQPGWAGGNNILIVLSGDSANTQDVNREMESFEGDTAGAPELFVTYIEGTGIESKKEFTCSVYPNPTEGQVCIDNPSDRNFSYEIFNINGQLVSSGHSLSGSSVEIDMSAFAKGTYIVDVESAERIETHKLILK